MAQYYVHSGETSTGKNLNYPDIMRVESGGTAINTTLNTESVLYVSTGGVASRTHLYTEAQIYVLPGGVASDTDVHESAYLYVSGLAKGVTVGSTAMCTIVANGGASYIQVAGTLNVYHTAADTTISSGGVMNVYSQGQANQVDVSSGGKLVVTSGGTALLVTENGGYVETEDYTYVTFENNTFTGLTLSNTSATVHSGTLATKITLNGAIMYVLGGEADYTTINSNGNLVVYRRCLVESTTVNSGGTLTLGGNATDVMVYEGGIIKFLLPVRLSALQATRYYARPYTALSEPDAKTFSIRIRRKQRGIEPAG